MMLIISSARQIREISNLRQPLPDVLSLAVETYHRLRAERGHKPRSLRVTSIYRSPQEDRVLGGSGVHTARPHRSIDIAMPWEWVKLVGKRVNSVWIYDPWRSNLKCAVTTKHGTGAHLHLQIHVSTILREELHFGLKV